MLIFLPESDELYDLIYHLSMLYFMIFIYCTSLLLLFYHLNVNLAFSFYYILKRYKMTKFLTKILIKTPTSLNPLESYALSIYRKLHPT